MSAQMKKLLRHSAHTYFSQLVRPGKVYAVKLTNAYEDMIAQCDTFTRLARIVPPTYPLNAVRLHK